MNKFLYGDCRELMKDITSNSIDFILCDLPYGTTKCSWDIIIPFDELWEQYNRIIKKDGAIVLTCSQPFTSFLIASNLKGFKYCIIWEKSKATGFLNAKRRHLVAHEEIAIFCNGKLPYYPQMTPGEAYNKGERKKQTIDDVYGSFKQTIVKSEGQRYPRSVIYFKTAESEGPVINKTQKPIALFEYLIKTFSKEGDLVLDNCAGSGTTAIACINTNRKFICIENDKNQYLKSLNRVYKI